MRLNDPLITSFEFKGNTYDIDMAFDSVLDVFDVLHDKTLRDQEKAEINLAILLGVHLKGNEAVNLWNYIYENFIYTEKKKPIQYDLAGNPMPTPDDGEEESHIDIEQDAELIYSSFMDAYQLDLFKMQGKLHWRKFQALLAGLPSSTIMQRVIQIRAWKPSKSDNGETKETMNKLQRIYALKD